jgi:hypothetical protein
MKNKFFVFFFIFILFSNKNFSQVFFNANGTYLGEISYSYSGRLNCGNCGAILDKTRNKIGEASPIGGYMQFKNNEGGTISYWTNNRSVYVNETLIGYSLNDKLYNSARKVVGYYKINGSTLTFYSSSKNTLMSAKGSTYISGHTFDLAMAYFFTYVY